MTQPPVLPQGYVVFPDAEAQERVDKRTFEMAWENGARVAEMFEERIFGFWKRTQRERYELTYAPNLPVFAVPCATCGKTGQVQVATELVPVDPMEATQQGSPGSVPQGAAGNQSAPPAAPPTPDVPVMAPAPVMGPCPMCEGRGWTEELPEAFVVQVAQQAEAAGYEFDQTEFLTPYWLQLFTHNPKETVKMWRDYASFLIAEQKRQEAADEAAIEEILEALP